MCTVLLLPVDNPIAVPRKTFWKADQKHLESFEMWCWRRMEKLSWTDRVRSVAVLQRVERKGKPYIK
jgi:hypothetical protein